MNRNPIASVRFLVLIFLVSILASGCDASLFFKSRKVSIANEPINNYVSQQISPAPSPVSRVDPGQGELDTTGKERVNETQKTAISPAPNPAVKSVERCPLGSSKICQYQNHVIVKACLLFSSNANSELFLLIQNDGESSLRVNVTISDVKSTFQEIEIPKKDVKKVHVADGGNPSILLNADNGKCIVQLGVSSVPHTNFFMRIPSYATNSTPRQKGASLLVLTGIIIGGIWFCFMLRKRKQRVNEVPYQELEMAQTDSPTANYDIETADGWDEEWDDDWDGTKAAKLPQQNGNASLNGHTSRSSVTNGWENNWDD